MNLQDGTPRSGRSSLVLWLILALYAAARVLEIVPNPLPRLVLVALDVVSAMAFALVHGVRQYGPRGVLAFTAICIVIGNTIENLGVLTGFPFGRYYFADLMGPKLFNIPVLLGLAYIGMAYVSWTLARMIVGESAGQPSRASWLALPVTASFIMVAWDLAQDPVWGTVLHGWVWQDGGPWFGVPISNYLGWYFNTFLIYLCFAFYLRRAAPAARSASRNEGPVAVLFYAVCAVGNVAQMIPTPNPAVVQDPSGAQWRVADITGASALVSIFVMGAFAVFAWIRIPAAKGPATD